MALTYQQIEDVWIRNGGDPGNAGMAAAIALAESGGNPDAVSPINTNGTIDRGLWQINSVHGALRSTTNLDANAKAAIAISNNGRDWTPWSTWWANASARTGPGQGAFRKFLAPGGNSIIPGTSIGPDTGGGPFDAIVKPFTDVAANIAQIIKAGQWFADPKNVTRIVQVGLGAGLVLVGLAILNRGLIEDAGKVVAKGAEVAAVL